MPAPRRASFTSSNLNGLMIAVTRCATGFSCRFAVDRSGGCSGRRRQWLRPEPRAEPLVRNRFGRLRLAGAGAQAAGARSARADRRRVAHAVAELHVVGGRPVFVDVDALELAVLFEAEVVRTGKLL